MSLYPELDDLSTDELVAAFWGRPPAGERDEPFLYYPDVAVRIAAAGPEGLRCLEAALADEDPFRVYASMLSLGSAPNAVEYEPTMGALLSDSRPLVVSTAIDFLTGQRRDEYLDKVAALVAHPEVAILTSALSYLAIVHPTIAERWLRPALQHPNPLVRWHGCDGFETMNRRSDVGLIETLLRDPDEDVRKKAAQTVHLLKTGELPG